MLTARTRGRLAARPRQTVYLGNISPPRCEGSHIERCCVLSECKLGHEVSEGGVAAAIISPVEVVATEAKQDFSFHARPSTVLVVNQKQVLHEGFTTKRSAKPVSVEAITFDLQCGDYAGVKRRIIYRLIFDSRGALRQFQEVWRHSSPISHLRHSEHLL